MNDFGQPSSRNTHPTVLELGKTSQPSVADAMGDAAPRHHAHQRLHLLGRSRRPWTRKHGGGGPEDLCRT